MPLAQSRRVGSSIQSASSSPATPDIPESAAGAGNGSRGGAAARQALQNGVNTRKGVPDPLVTVHGSCSRLAWKLCTVRPALRRLVLSRVSTSLCGPP